MSVPPIEFPILSTILLCPVIALLAVLLTPGRYTTAIKLVSLVASAATLVLSIWLCLAFNAKDPSFQYIERLDWVRSYGIQYANAVDGLNVAMILLTAIVIFCGILVSWGVTYRTKDFFANMLFLVAGVFGVFMTTNLFFFFLFYEVAVIPMYLLIVIWGSTNKQYAAMKLTLYLLLGSALMFAGFLYIYSLPDARTFDLLAIKQQVTFSPMVQNILYISLFVGFGVLAACFPFHVWSPDGHVAAPTAASMLHAGVLMKLGAFGILRIGVYLFPDGARFWAPTIAVLALCNIVYGAMVATQQRDLKYIIGYSSVSHMGIVLLGIATMTVSGFNGALFQMFSHGIMTALFFACVGFIYDGCHTRMLDELGGLSKTAPRISAFFIIAGLCGLGLPGMGSFVAELLVTVAAIGTYPVIGITSLLALLVTAYYVLSAVQKVFYGPENHHHKDFKDINGFQFIPRAVLVGCLIFFGVFPQIFLDWVNASTRALLGA
ncbi:MAG: NAD(P)H-quinone oxidoreductase chain 4 1 [Candidatus Omnitrophica bacterium]|nr:NAD(P)H-quinone oxidoreductase chain 4 1 [Candidatus Omnitrophota bacterium]